MISSLTKGTFTFILVAVWGDRLTVKEVDFDNFDMDFSLYKIFYLVCQNTSFTKTAELLGVTQPSISYSIKKLEDSLGVKLFERGNILMMTPEAESLLPYVEEALNSLKKGESKVNDLVNLKKGQIAIGAPSHIGLFLLTNIIEKFNKEYPNVKIKVTCKPTKELFRLLNINELDVLIDCSPLEDNINNFIIIKIASENCALACNIKHSELLNRKISLKDLTGYPLIVPARTSGSTKSLIAVYEENGVKFDPLFEITTSDMIAVMVERNMGIGFLFEKTIKMHSTLKKIDIKESLPIFDIFLIYKDYLLSSATQTFIAFVKKSIKKY